MTYHPTYLPFGNLVLDLAGRRGLGLTDLSDLYGGTTLTGLLTGAVAPTEQDLEALAHLLGTTTATLGETLAPLAGPVTAADIPIDAEMREHAAAWRESASAEVLDHAVAESLRCA